MHAARLARLPRAADRRRPDLARDGPSSDTARRSAGRCAWRSGTAAGFALQEALLARIDALAAWVPADAASVPWWLGAAAGAAAELSELPNSFVKRRLGIAPGHTAKGVLSVVFYLWDQLDLLLGYWLVLATAVPVTGTRVAASVVLVGLLHPVTTLAGYLLGMRPTAR